MLEKWNSTVFYHHLVASAFDNMWEECEPAVPHSTKMLKEFGQHSWIVSMILNWNGSSSNWYMRFFLKSGDKPFEFPLNPERSLKEGTTRELWSELDAFNNIMTQDYLCLKIFVNLLWTSTLAKYNKMNN